MISNSLRSIDLNIFNIKEIQETLDYVNDQLSDIYYQESDEYKKYKIHNIKKYIQKNSIYDLPVFKIEDHIKKLITIIDYEIYDI